MAPKTKSDSKAAAKPTKAGKKVKDPNAPKLPLSSYFVFNNEKRPIVKAANPDMKLTDIAKEVSLLWHALDEKEKSKYEAIAQKDKERYAAEKAAYDAKNSK